MLFILIATIAIGLAAAGLVLGLKKLTGLSLPRYGAPLAAGVAMAAFMLWNEYTWFDRTRAALPAEARIAETYEHASWLQPWTLAVPRIARFAAVIPEDGGTAEARPAVVFVAERLSGQRMIPHVFDCTGNRRAALGRAGWDALIAGEAPGDPDWVAAGPTDPLMSAACTPDQDLERTPS